MNPIELTISYLDGSDETVSAVAADLIAFESYFDLSVTRLEKELRLTHLVYLAWHALKRTKKTDQEFGDFAERVAGVSQAEGKGSKG